MMVFEQLRFRFPRAVGAVQARIAFFRKAASFGVVGLINTGIDFAVFWIAVQEFGLPLIPANVLAWVVANSGSFVMNSLFTFAAESGGKLRWRAYGTFVASGVVGLVANTATLVVAAKLMPLLLAGEDAQLAAAKACAILASFVVNFSLSHFVVFRRRVGPAGEGR
jgi:putative flippase GtrA